MARTDQELQDRDDKIVATLAQTFQQLEKIANENPYVDDIEGFEKLLINEETCPEDDE